MKMFETLSEAMEDLKKRGYTHDFLLKYDLLECETLDLRLTASEFHVDEVHRFEGLNDPDDSTILFAISATNGSKGLIVDAYGAYADTLHTDMIKHLKLDRDTQH